MEILENEPNDKPSPWAGLGTRAASGIALAGSFLAVLWFGGVLFNMLVLVAAMLMVKEWNALTDDFGPRWRAAGLVYAALPCASLIWLRDLQGGTYLVIYLVLIVAATDIGAYFTGKKFGRHKLAPVISPGKTWEGLGGGVAAAGVLGLLFAGLTPFHWTTGFMLALIMALVAQGGDLFESWIKRRAGVKDSGSLIPGHGGLLDRVDGLTFTLPLYAWCIFISGYAAN